MKTTITFLIAFFLTNSVFSQNNEDKKKPDKQNKVNKEMYVGFQLGISMVGILNKGLSESEDSILGFYKYFGKSSPVIGITADAFVSKKITIGVNFSFQNLKMDIDSWQYAINDYSYSTSYNNKANLNRIYIGGKILYHFVNNSRADLYSGLRFGIIKWNMKLDNSSPELREQIFTDKIFFNRPALALIPIGTRIKFNDKLAFNTELTLGAPNFISAGLTYKFSEKEKN